MTLPIRARLTLWYGSLLAAALIIFAGVVYLIMARALQSNLDTTLQGRVTHLQSKVEVKNGSLILPHGEEQSDEPLVPDALLNPAGKVSLGQVPASLVSALAGPLLPHGTAISYGNVGGLRYALVPIMRKGRIAGYVLAWQSLQPVEDARHSLLWVLVSAGPLLLLVATLGGFGLAGRALRPVRHVTRVASEISATDLQGRVPVSPARDELSELATTFNAMIDRLQSGVERERRFAADASHELRSPLAVIRAEATLALDRSRSEEEYRRVLQVIDEQAAAMEDLVGSLLLLARAETLRSQRHGPVEMDGVIAAAIALCEPLMAEAQVRVERRIEEELSVEGSSALLTRAVRNLVDNAVRVSPPGETVLVRARRNGETVVVDVEDHGPGISARDRQHLFEPFFQVSSARTPGDSHGLGLAICSRIVAAHGGEIAVESVPGEGSTFRVVLPALPLRDVTTSVGPPPSTASRRAG